MQKTKNTNNKICSHANSKAGKINGGTHGSN